MPVKNHIKDNKLHNLKETIAVFWFFLVPKHLAESPQEDKIICTWLLRGALHKDHFSKITAWLAFIPYFWKPSCFLRLPLLPLFLLPPPSSLPSPLCHVLVFICWFCSSSFSPCVKNERLKIGWVRGKKSRRQKQRLYISEITVCSAETVLFSALTVTDYNTAPEPYPYTSHSANQTLSTDNAKCSLCPVLNYCIPMWYSYSMTRGTALPSATGSCIKTPFKSHSNVQAIWKAKPAPCMFFELVINHAHCSVTGEAKQG